MIPFIFAFPLWCVSLVRVPSVRMASSVSSLAGRAVGLFEGRNVCTDGGGLYILVQEMEGASSARRRQPGPTAAGQQCGCDRWQWCHTAASGGLLDTAGGQGGGDGFTQLPSGGQFKSDIIEWRDGVDGQDTISEGCGLEVRVSGLRQWERETLADMRWARCVAVRHPTL
ncbi:unnamed protein product [Vitrella brassicaformis CCMP3155]|uniref:Uncharacterized protein n=1 Tax=Vitrella brassicaformis (strain CCMP3155) TaxID=1169540 RepID=A0A0G4H515_VITBC|nr:unnamed protein product [Vitrella brassicaformis CCMP3155]|eukprot:CEM38772.1 unnamed protein product [Vitrella brassicaformis CCMP3155]